MTEQIKIQFPNDTKYLDWIHSITEAIASRLPFSESSRRHLVLAMSEGVTNAMIHGNQHKTNASVNVVYEISDEFLCVCIEDQGILPIKSNIDSLITPSADSDESGRGLALIRRLTSEANIQHVAGLGNVLTIKMLFERNRSNKTVIHGEVANGCQG
jgi:anti-sigma regulatory factor (Ser/Thr protein kinase)